MPWLLAANGVDHVPSIPHMESQQAGLREQFAIGTKRYDGALGRTYYVNSLGRGLSLRCAQHRSVRGTWGSRLVRLVSRRWRTQRLGPIYHFYPGDAGDTYPWSTHGKVVGGETRAIQHL